MTRRNGHAFADIPLTENQLKQLHRDLWQQKRHLAIKVEREKVAFAVLSVLAVKILDYVRDYGRVTTRDMVRETGASPNTLKVTFDSLVEKGHPVRHAGGRSIWYCLP